MKRIVPAGEAVADYRDPGFSSAIINWQKQFGRHALPWQNTRDAYRIWLSEIMLQQTQVTAVIPYYARFLQRFPDLPSLAQAPVEDVMALWSGLGYYTRARNLHKCAQQVWQQYQGQFPQDPELLAQLPGIGRSTAAAIAAFSGGVRAAILDGNVKRVFARVFGIDSYPGEKKTEQQLWLRAQALLPEQGIEAYTQGLMDLGATLCTRSRPQCPNCPLQARCVAHAEGRVEQLPVRKEKRTVPEKYAHMLVVICEGKVLLQQRPPLGIWGGLWSVPELAGHQADAEMVSAEQIRLAAAKFGSVQECYLLPGFSHVFTHFKLHIQPWCLVLATKAQFAAQQEYVWLSQNECQDAGLPAPIKKMLLSLPCFG